MKLNNPSTLGKTQKRLSVSLLESSDYQSSFTLVKIHLGWQCWGVRYFFVQSFPYHMTSVQLRGCAVFSDHLLCLEGSNIESHCHMICELQTLIVKWSLPSGCQRLLICFVLATSFSQINTKRPEFVGSMLLC